MGFDAGDSNLYRYVNNAPTNFTDPSGLWTQDGMIREYKRLYPEESEAFLKAAEEFRITIKSDSNRNWVDAWKFYNEPGKRNTIEIAERAGPWILFGQDWERTDENAAEQLHRALGYAIKVNVSWKIHSLIEKTIEEEGNRITLNLPNNYDRLDPRQQRLIVNFQVRAYAERKVLEGLQQLAKDKAPGVDMWSYLLGPQGVGVWGETGVVWKAIGMLNNPSMVSPPGGRLPPPPPPPITIGGR